MPREPFRAFSAEPVFARDLGREARAGGSDLRFCDSCVIRSIPCAEESSTPEGLSTRPCGQRILSPLETASLSLTKRYEPVFTGLAAVKVMLGPAMSRDRLSSS